MNTGYIDIQGESTPWKFKVIKVLDLEGCMDPKAANYRSYFIKSNPSACIMSTMALERSKAVPLAITIVPGEIRVALPDRCAYKVGVLDLHGKRPAEFPAENAAELKISTRDFQPGMYVIAAKSGGGADRTRSAFVEIGRR